MNTRLHLVTNYASLSASGLSLGLGLLLCSLAPVPGAAPASRPNIVFILADDLGWGDIGCFGSRFHKTPNLDALSKRGMIFTQAYAANPLCSPTRASILTGQYPARIGITAPVCHLPEVRLKATIQERAATTQKCFVASSVTRLDTNYVTLAELLKSAGYVTGHFGKWHLGADPYSPRQQGFDVDVPHHPGPGPAGSYVAPWKFAAALNFTGVPGEHIEDRMAKEAAGFIRQNKDRPFFLNYWAFSVHAPYDAKKSLVERYRQAMDENVPQHNPLYAAMVQSLDDAVGTLVKALKAEKVFDRTIIVFFSDNGGVNWQAMKKEGRGDAGDLSKPFADIPPTSNAPLRGGKASVFEGGIREPCIVVWPGVVRKASRSDAMIQSIDFLPTLAEAAGAELPAQQKLDGRSFLPVLRGKAKSHRDTIFTFFPHNTAASSQLPACSVRRNEWKLIRYFHDGPKQEHRYELYNLRDDLGETQDVSADQKALVKDLDSLIEGFLSDTGAVVPGPNPAWSPNAKPGDSARKEKAPADPLQGWKARGCIAEVTGGNLKITRTGGVPFLGFAAGKLESPAKLRFRLQCDGGTGKVDWLPGPGAGPEQTKTKLYSVKAGGWTDIIAEIPAPRDQSGIIRLYLPAQDQPLELDWIELTAGGKTRRWDFEAK